MKKFDGKNNFILLFRELKFIIKITTLCLIGIVSSIPVSATYAQSHKMSINERNSTILKIIRKIEQNSEFTFFFNANDVNVNKPATVKAKNASIEEILDQLLKDSGYEYVIMNKQILIKIPETKSFKIILQNNPKKKTITGIVKDLKGEIIIGANIVEKGTVNGTSTDVNGKFTLLVGTNATLIVSCIGYVPQEIKMNGKQSFDVILEESTETLDEAIVVGYGTVNRKDLTGSVAAVKGKDLVARKTTQLSTALQGAVSGVLVTRASGPGATANIKIRGVTTIGETSPLVIIDGIPGDINQVNPDDVENISVLKDAASASIYGSRAAAGVIVITTKRATENDLRLNYNFEYGWEMPTMLPKYVGVERYMEMVNETRYNDNKTGGRNQTYTEYEIKNWRKNNSIDPDSYPITDWQNEILKTSAARQTHSLSIIGGGKNVQTRASFRYDKVEGLYANKNYERYIFKVNNDVKINKFIKTYLDVHFKRSKSESPHINPMAAYRSNPPIYAVRWSNGMWGNINGGGNIVALITDGGSKTSYYNRLGGKIGIDIMPIEGLKISGIFAPSFTFDKIKSFRQKVPYTSATDPTTIVGYMADFPSTKLSEDRNDNYNMTTQFFANYKNCIGMHDFSIMVGYEDYYEFWEKLGASRDQYELSNFPYLNVGPKILRDNSGSAEEYAYRSVFSRFSYDYANRYLLQINFRRDGSSRFSSRCRWANFPSFSAAWVMSEEKFMENMKWLSFLKLRGSWGTLGNERIGGLYPYQAVLDFNSTLFYNGIAVNSVLTASQQNYAVRDISWETTESWDVGLDINLGNNRLAFSGDFYKKKTKDMLLPLEIPKFIGYNNPSVNAGNMYTIGYDLEVKWHDHIGNFNYSVSANLSDFISKMGNLKGTEFLGDKIKKQGSEFNEWYGYLSEGLYQTLQEVEHSPKLNNKVSVGDIKYRDISGPEGVPDGKISPEYDRVKLGGSLPRYMYGINLSFSYKGFDVSTIFQGVGKQNVRIEKDMVEGLGSNWRGFPAVRDGNYWSEKNTKEQNAKVKYPRLTYDSSSSNMVMSDYWLFNGRYFRMKNLTLGYTLPSVFSKKINVQSIRFYVSGTDLFCLSKYLKGWDPEVSVSGDPMTMSLLLGISVNF